mmetsp:Transcript_24440/g.47510  ORF Transcript_24440/g.47510 Transcript_24440/m.47510 type:complete len:257 (+) Transcript_24440:239-1009(+)
MGKKGGQEKKEALPSDFWQHLKPPKTFDRTTKTWVSRKAVSEDWVEHKTQDGSSDWVDGNKVKYESALLGVNRGCDDEEQDSSGKADARRPKRLVLDGLGKTIDVDVLSEERQRWRRAVTVEMPNAIARAPYKPEFEALLSSIHQREGGVAKKPGFEEWAGRTPLWERKEAKEMSSYVVRRVPRRALTERIVITGDAPQVGRGTRRPVTAFDGTIFHSLHAPHSTPRSSRNPNLQKGYHFFPKKKNAQFWSMTNAK